MANANASNGTTDKDKHVTRGTTAAVVEEVKKDPAPLPKLKGSVMIPRSKIVYDPKENSRDNFGKPMKAFKAEDQTKLEDLAATIRQDGLINPPTVEKIEDGKYRIVAGSRRFRALTEILGYEEIPCVVKESADDFEKLRLQLVENVQRENLRGPDLAMGLYELKKRAKARGEKLTDEQIGAMVGRSRPNITNYIRAARQLIPEWMRAWRGEGGIVMSEPEIWRLAGMEQEEQKKEWEARKEADNESGEGGKGKKGAGGKIPPMARRGLVEELFRAVSTRPTFEATVEEVYLGGKNRSYLPAGDVSDEALAMLRQTLHFILNPKDRTPPFKYMAEEEETEETDEE